MYDDDYLIGFQTKMKMFCGSKRKSVRIEGGVNLGSHFSVILDGSRSFLENSVERFWGPSTLRPLSF